MEQHPLHLFVPFLMKELAEDEDKAVVTHLESCDLCRKQFDASLQTISELAMFAPPIPPPPILRDRVLAQFEGGKKFAAFAEQVSTMLGIAHEQVMVLFDQLDELSNWQPGPSKGCYMLPVRSDLQAAYTGFIRLEPNTVFPAHTHKGREHLFLLSGGYFDEEGHSCRAGQHDIHEAETSHTITSMQWVPCICVLVIDGGFEFI